MQVKATHEMNTSINKMKTTCKSENHLKIQVKSGDMFYYPEKIAQKQLENIDRKSGAIILE